jgi:hypothetical protein
MQELMRKNNLGDDYVPEAYPGDLSAEPARGGSDGSPSGAAGSTPAAGHEQPTRSPVGSNVQDEDDIQKRQEWDIQEYKRQIEAVGRGEDYKMRPYPDDLITKDDPTRPPPKADGSLADMFGTQAYGNAAGAKAGAQQRYTNPLAAGPGSGQAGSRAGAGWNGIFGASAGSSSNMFAGVASAGGIGGGSHGQHGGYAGQGRGPPVYLPSATAAGGAGAGGGGAGHGGVPVYTPGPAAVVPGGYGMSSSGYGATNNPYGGHGSAMLPPGPGAGGFGGMAPPPPGIGGYGGMAPPPPGIGGYGGMAPPPPGVGGGGGGMHASYLSGHGSSGAGIDPRLAETIREGRAEGEQARVLHDEGMKLRGAGLRSEAGPTFRAADAAYRRALGKLVPCRRELDVGSDASRMVRQAERGKLDKLVTDLMDRWEEIKPLTTDDVPNLRPPAP